MSERNIKDIFNEEDGRVWREVMWIRIGRSGELL
jgi:hypothetical protein